jgi:hypothetical protein
MTTRSFIKSALAFPVVSLANTVIPEQKYGFNFIGGGMIENKTDFEFYHSPYYIADNQYDILLVIHAHYSSGVLFHKRAIEVPKDSKYNEERIEQAVYDEMTSKPIFSYTSHIPVEPQKSFTTIKEYHKYPTKFMEKINQKLIENKYTVDVYTDFSSFKHMMDTKYKGDYSQEFLDDIRQMNF